MSHQRTCHDQHQPTKFNTEGPLQSLVKCLFEQRPQKNSEQQQTLFIFFRFGIIQKPEWHCRLWLIMSAEREKESGMRETGWWIIELATLQSRGVPYLTDQSARTRYVPDIFGRQQLLGTLYTSSRCCYPLYQNLESLQQEKNELHCVWKIDELQHCCLFGWLARNS